MGDSYNFEEIGNFMGRVAANLIDEDGDYITATHIDKKINLNVLDISANSKLTKMVDALENLSFDGATITIPAKIDISGAEFTYDGSFNKNQLNVVDLKSNAYLNSIANYIQNNGIKLTDSNGNAIDSTIENSKRQLDVKDFTSNQYLNLIATYIHENGIKLTDSNGNAIDSTFENNKRQLDVKDYTTNEILFDGIKIKDAAGNNITGTIDENQLMPEDTKVYLDVHDNLLLDEIDSGVKLTDTTGQIVTVTENPNEDYEGNKKVYLDVYDENLLHEIDSGVKLTDTTGKIVTVTENIYPGYDGETKVYLDVYDENIHHTLVSGLKLIDSTGNNYTSTHNENIDNPELNKVYLDVYDENSHSQLVDIVTKLVDLETKLIDIDNKVLNIYELKINANTTKQIFTDQFIFPYANNSSPYSSIIDLSDIYVMSISIYGKFDYKTQPGNNISTKLIIEYSPNSKVWFETEYQRTITTSLTQNYFGFNIANCGAKYIRLYIEPAAALTINAYIDTK
jgi:hypothetical protein